MAEVRAYSKYTGEEIDGLILMPETEIDNYLEVLFKKYYLQNIFLRDDIANFNKLFRNWDNFKKEFKNSVTDAYLAFKEKKTFSAKDQIDAELRGNLFRFFQTHEGHIVDDLCAICFEYLKQIPYIRDYI